MDARIIHPYSTNEGLDNSTTVNSPDSTGLAVAVGRIEESQKNLQRSVDRVESKVDGVTQTVANHSVQIQKLETEMDGIKQVTIDRAPIRVPWTGILAAILSIVAVLATLYTVLRP